MKSKAILVALLALAFQAQAASVSRSDAESAVRAWAAGGRRHLGVSFGSGAVEKSASHSTTNGAVFYSVKLRGGGTVFTSADTSVTPIIAFTAATNDFTSIDRRSPLWALLNSDLSSRRVTSRGGGLAYASSPSSAAGSNAAAWRSLVAVGARPDYAGADLDPSRTSVSDVRVDVLVKSKWSQGERIWNYYTPPGNPGDKKNYVCGCVATAAAQIMRYFHGPVDDGGLGIPIPNADVAAKTFTCQVDDKPVQLTMQGGQYAWDDMPLTPLTSGGITEDQRKNIGKITSDFGITVSMMYAADGSGSYTSDVPGSLVDNFGYAQAVWVQINGEITPEGGKVLQNTLFANFDAGRPCAMSIPGHAIVADGYGYEGDVPYVHLNMGWAGSCDFWYNLPDITEASKAFDAVNGIGYNIFPEIGGIVGEMTTHAIVSGRVLDEDGNPVSGCAVTVYEPGTYTAVTSVTSGANGIWAAILPAGTYDFMAKTDDDEWIGVAESVLLTVPTTHKDRSSLVASATAVGNSWGNDLVLEHPSVRVGGVVFSSIDRGIAAARELAASTGEAALVEVLDTTRLKATATIDFDCVLMATNATPAASAVTRLAGAQFVVAPEASFVVSNIVFAAGDNTVVEVEDGGSLSLSGKVDFGVSDYVAAVHTVAATGFTLLGAVSPGFTLSCDAATEEGSVFGSAVATDTATFNAICACAPRIANAADEWGEMRGYVKGSSPTYSLVWQTQPVPLTDAVGYYLDAGGNKKTAARIDRLFDKYAAALAAGELGDTRKIVILKNGSMSRFVPVADGLTLTGKTGGVDVDLAKASNTVFSVTGGLLSVSGVTFRNYVGNAVFLVNGSGASLRLGAGVQLVDIVGTNSWSGAVCVRNGLATLTGGAVLDNCRATGQYSPARVKNAYGGAVYVASGKRLKLSGCTIRNCYARNYGGAVFAEAKSTVEFSGELNIVGNTSGSNSKLVGDDVYLKNGNNRATATITDAVTGKVGIMWSSSTGSFGNTNGLALAEAASATVAHSSAAAFFSDATASLVAEPYDALPGLRWNAAPTGPQPWTGPVSAASALVKGSDGSQAYYLLVSEALKAVNSDATIWVTGWTGNTIGEDITITNSVTLRSDTNKGFFWIDRSADCSLIIGKGGKIIMKDIVVYGSDVTNDTTMAFSEEPRTAPLFDVQGGELRMVTPSDSAQYQTAIVSVRGAGRDAGAVSVWKGGIFRMYPGTEISDCINEYDNAADGSGRGAAVLVDDGTAVFTGGTVTGCKTYTGGGVFIGNKGKIRVSGDVNITGNTDLKGKANNLVVYDQGSLRLDAKLTGSIGYIEGVSGDTEVFGYAADDVTPADALSSAHNFTHDVTGDVGLAVTGSAGTLLVWGSAPDSSGKYTDEEGNEYTLVSGGDKVKVDAPTAVSGLVYNGKAQTGVPAGTGYTLTDYKKTNAGSYTAVATPRPGFSWSDGSTSAKSISWKIAKATYDMSAVVFADATYTYSGEYYALEITGELPDGVTVSYENNRQRDVGVYTATASFAGDSANYMTIPDKTAKLTIVAAEEPVPPPDDPPGPEPAQPVPVAFAAIAGADGTTWTLTVTDAVEKCWYSLYETNSLTGGFATDGLEPVARRQAASGDVPSIVFERMTDGSQVFWKVVAEPEDAH